MRLPRPFLRLNVHFDAKRLATEVAALPATAWSAHPNDIPGNSSVRMISVDGAENDAVNGRMDMSPHLRQSPYIRQILASFGVVWGRSRLMRLAPGAQVPPHADINYHWFTRVRLHIPVTTQPDVRFYCGTESVHMAAGEAWIFDNWRLHRVENPTSHERIHLVADTSGSSSFWQFVARGQLPGVADQECVFDAERSATPLVEHALLAPVMPPAEVDLLTMDLRAEIVSTAGDSESSARLQPYHALLEGFCKDWRQMYLLHGEAEEGWPQFHKLRESVRVASKELAEGLCLQTNRVPAHTVLEGRVLRPMLTPSADPPGMTTSEAATRRRTTVADMQFAAPVFIVAAPRSGSTVLFETLAASENIVTVGGEAHELIEGIQALRAGAPGIDSNRLTRDAYTREIGGQLGHWLSERLVDSAGRPVTSLGRRQFLEKTPKNSLRIPFLDRAFPDAHFIYLWRDPRENLSSIMQAWRSGNWKTYNGLEGFDGPWSLILPPGWRALNGRPLEEIAAFQWETTNRIALDDLAALPSQRWTSVSYGEFISSPQGSVERLCRFMGLVPDPALRARVATPLPLSRFTQTPPSPEKWRVNAASIDKVLPSLSATWQRLKALT